MATRARQTATERCAGSKEAAADATNDRCGASEASAERPEESEHRERTARSGEQCGSYPLRAQDVATGAAASPASTVRTANADPAISAMVCMRYVSRVAVYASAC